MIVDSFKMSKSVLTESFGDHGFYKNQYDAQQAEIDSDRRFLFNLCVFVIFIKKILL